MNVERYIIDMFYDHKTKSYTCNETIELNGNEENFVINSINHNISKIFLNGSEVTFEKGKKDDELVINGKLTDHSVINLTFAAVVPISLTGLYLAKTQDGSEMVTSQFESVGARRAFPCFDVPILKAKFKISVKVDNSLDVISNMPIEGEISLESDKRVIFQETPKMPTYLVYIGIGPLENKTYQYKNTNLFLSGLKNNLDTSDFPLKIASECLEFFNNYTGIQYMLPKLHLISVPEFAAGAMENWGAITFRESDILINKGSGGSSLKRVASVIAHEIAHQWFGDLVTMKWWNDLWLNESFATFMANKEMEHYHPEWKLTGDMLLSDGRGGFFVDSLHCSKPIQSEEFDMDKLNQVPSEIIYGKGGMILRMIESYTGERDFVKGLHEYLLNFSYSNAEGSDLWNSIEVSSEKPIQKIMEAWIMNQGYPYIEVEESGNKLKLTQNSFYLDGATDDKIWPIPLTIKRSDNIESLLMETKVLKIDSDKFIKVNSRTSGFYRVLYQENFYSDLESIIQTEEYEDLIGIMSDLFAFLISGRIKLSLYLEAVKQMRNVDEYNVATEISDELNELIYLLNKNNILRDEFLKFHWAQVERLESKLSLDINDSILYGTLLKRLIIIDGQKRLALSEKFKTLNDENPDIRESISVAFAITTKNIDIMVEKLLVQDNDNDRVKIIRSMGYISDPTAYQKVINLIKDEKIKRQDVSIYFNSFGSKRENSKLAFEKLSEMISILTQISPRGRTGSSLIANVVPIIGIGKYNEIGELLNSIKNDKFEIGILRGMEKLRINEQFIKEVGNYD
jgi:tricorn protease interacting factor F2/3